VVFEGYSSESYTNVLETTECMQSYVHYFGARNPNRTPARICLI